MIDLDDSGQVIALHRQFSDWFNQHAPAGVTDQDVTPEFAQVVDTRFRDWLETHAYRTVSPTIPTTGTNARKRPREDGEDETEEGDRRVEVRRLRRQPRRSDRETVTKMVITPPRSPTEPGERSSEASKAKDSRSEEAEEVEIDEEGGEDVQEEEEEGEAPVPTLANVPGNQAQFQQEQNTRKRNQKRASSKSNQTGQDANMDAAEEEEEESIIASGQRKPVHVDLSTGEDENEESPDQNMIEIQDQEDQEDSDDEALIPVHVEHHHHNRRGRRGAAIASKILPKPKKPSAPKKTSMSKTTAADGLLQDTESERGEMMTKVIVCKPSVLQSSNAAAAADGEVQQPDQKKKDHFKTEPSYTASASTAADNLDSLMTRLWSLHWTKKKQARMPSSSLTTPRRHYQARSSGSSGAGTAVPTQTHQAPPPGGRWPCLPRNLPKLERETLVREAQAVTLIPLLVPALVSVPGAQVPVTVGESTAGKDGEGR